MRLRAAWLERKEDARAWCDDRSWIPRAALLAYLAYAGVRHIADPLYRSWFGGITLAIHELGHVALSWAGRTMHALGGSIFQLAAPLGAAIYLLVRQGDYFGFAACNAWLAFSAWELATYVGDARAEELPLVGLGGNPEHDWSVILGGWHALAADHAIAATIRVVAFGVWGASMALGAWLCFTMWRSRRAAA